jgi:hypothetical protein
MGAAASLRATFEVRMIQDNKPTVRRIAFIGNYIPRQCGIATFTTDLAEAVSTTYYTTCFTA